MSKEISAYCDAIANFQSAALEVEHLARTLRTTAEKMAAWQDLIPDPNADPKTSITADGWPATNGCGDALRKLVQAWKHLKEAHEVIPKNLGPAIVDPSAARLALFQLIETQRAGRPGR